MKDRGLKIFVELERYLSSSLFFQQLICISRYPNYSQILRASQSRPLFLLTVPIVPRLVNFTKLHPYRSLKFSLMHLCISSKKEIQKGCIKKHEPAKLKVRGLIMEMIKQDFYGHRFHRCICPIRSPREP